MYKGAKILGDIDAVAKGKTGRRVKNIVVGNLLTRLLRNLFR